MGPAVTAPPARAAVAGLDEGLVLDPARPLYVCHVRGPLTLAVVSIARLRTLGEAARTALESRHLDASEAARAAGLALPKRRLEWLAGRLALKHGVCAYRARHFGARTRTRDVRVGAVAEGLRAAAPGSNSGRTPGRRRRAGRLEGGPWRSGSRTRWTSPSRCAARVPWASTSN